MVFHAHIPFVHRTPNANTLQERWLYEAVIESYLPLLQSFWRLKQEGVPFRAAFSLTPVLLSMLADDRYMDGLRRHISRLIELSSLEMERNKGTAFSGVASWYHERFLGLRAFLDDELGGNVTRGFRVLAESCELELMTSAATHGYLPLMKGQQAMKAQVRAGIDEFERVMGLRPKGMWLPECGFTPGVDEILAALGMNFFIVDSHVIENARPCPPAGVHRPVATPPGVAAFGRDRESSRQVWDRHVGYPGDYEYREFYRDIGWDLPLEYIGPYVLDGGVRADTGLKYHRITGPGLHKEVYQPERAMQKAREHARHFVWSKRDQTKRLVASGVKDPVIVAPYDAELFGHWWFEGPVWVEEVFRTLAGDQTGEEAGLVECVTPSGYLASCPPSNVVNLYLGSWGAGGYNEVWLNGANDWLYPRLHRAEERMEGLARAYPEATGLIRRALNQAARELLLAQSSDWAFMITMNSTPDYAVERAKGHLAAFDALYEGIVGRTLTEEMVRELEEKDSPFPSIDYRSYRPDGAPAPFTSRVPRRGVISEGRGRTVRPLRIMMLSWEFPPFIVGGLGHHMAGLTEGLAALGHRVSVITASCQGAPVFSEDGGVRVWRTGPEPGKGDDFLGWVYSFNESLVRQASSIIEVEGCDLIHAHDWLVGPAAIALKQRFGVPLIATIHATEHGRNGGLYTDLQRTIHREEWRLTREADRVIACSRYMVNEVMRLFAVPPWKTIHIPNAVASASLDAAFIGDEEGGKEGDGCAPAKGKIVLYVGRLVAEKGVQVLLEAVPAVLHHHPDALFFIAGRGPYEEELRSLAGRLGVGTHVRFLGYVEEREKQRLMRQASVIVVPSLYEPFGIIALEAMAAGTPVVATDAGGLDEVLDHWVTGIKVPAGDPGALGQAISEVLGDDALSRGLAARAAVAVRERFSWDAAAVMTQGLYREVVTQPAAATIDTIGRRIDVASPCSRQRPAACHV